MDFYRHAAQCAALIAPYGLRTFEQLNKLTKLERINLHYFDLTNGETEALYYAEGMKTSFANVNDFMYAAIDSIGDFEYSECRITPLETHKPEPWMIAYKPTLEIFSYDTYKPVEPIIGDVLFVELKSDIVHELRVLHSQNWYILKYWYTTG